MFVYVLLCTLLYIFPLLDTISISDRRFFCFLCLAWKRTSYWVGLLVFLSFAVGLPSNGGRVFSLVRCPLMRGTFSSELNYRFIPSMEGNCSLLAFLSLLWAVHPLDGGELSKCFIARVLHRPGSSPRWRGLCLFSSIKIINTKTNFSKLPARQ